MLPPIILLSRRAGPYVGLFVAWILTSAAASAQANDAGIEFFEKRIRPVLVEHCYSCHSTGAKRAGAHRAHLPGAAQPARRDRRARALRVAVVGRFILLVNPLDGAPALA